MKFLPIIALAPLLMLLSACGQNVSPEHQAAVEAVHDKFMKAKLTGLDEFSADAGDTALDPWTRSRQLEIKAIEAIDVSRCPEPFQDSWEKYVRALKLDDPTVGMNMALAESDPDAYFKSLEARKPLNDATEELTQQFEKYSEKLALEFARLRESQKK